jgi:hypothetical protein
VLVVSTHNKGCIIQRRGTNVCPIPSMTWVFEMMMFLEGEPTAKFGQVVS